jgi:hypothetical protein
MGFHLFDGAVRNWQTEFFLGNGEAEPEFTPCREAGLYEQEISAGNDARLSFSRRTAGEKSRAISADAYLLLSLCAEFSVALAKVVR